MIRRDLIVGLLLAAFWICEPVRSAAPRNLLLITIDTLRADHLGCNGSSKVKTPHLDRLAREGVNFLRARSPVPLTLPAHASILTGNYPPTHTVRSNGEFRLPESQTSLAEVLGGRGYATAAFVASFVLDRRFGLDQGFGFYDDAVWSEVEEMESLAAERTGGEVLDIFKEWYRTTRRSEPFFAWVHLYDPHAPYDPPEPYRSGYSEDPYSGEVAYTDAVVGEVLDELAAAGGLSNTLVAVVGDHGEGLGDHGEKTHSLLIFNSTLHVPMILWGPGTIPAGRRIDDLVRIIDLAPTLLDYLGLSSDFGEGTSLRPLVVSGSDSGHLPTADLTAYSESIYPELALGWSSLRGLEEKDRRLVLAPTSLLFNLGEDADETVNIAEADPGSLQRLKRQLADMMRLWNEKAGQPVQLDVDSETQERLRSLGYLSGSGGTTRRRGPGPDPNKGIGLWNRIQLGIALVDRSEYSPAIEIFEEVLESDAEMPLIYEYLGTCWVKLHDLDQAEQIYREGIRRGLSSPRLHSEWGRILFQRGDLEAAEREMQAAAALDPRSVVIQYDLGNLYRRQGEHSLAVEHYESALELNPQYLWAWNGLAMSLAASGAMERASAAFQRVVEIDPEGAAGYFNLAVHLDRVGRGAEARKGYERFLELSLGQGLELQRRQAQEALSRIPS